MKTNKRVNWVDGMLINKMHFKGMEDYLLSTIYTTNRLLFSGGYGIIGNKLNHESDYPLIKLSVDSSDSTNQVIIIEQLEFLAVNPSGTLLDISNENFFYQKGAVESSKPRVIVNVEDQKISHGDPLYLVLLTQPYETQGVGQSNDKEEPLRFPFCSPISELKCVSSNSDIENIVGPNHFPIAKIKIINNRLEIDRNYLPPCYTVSSHYQLRNRSLNLMEGLLNITNNIDAFIQNNQDVSDKNTSFLKNLYFILYSRLIEITEYFNDEKEGINPNEIFRAIKVLALQLKKLLLCNADAYTFFTEIWNSKYGVNFNSFSLEIDHLKKIKSFDINESLEVCERILEDFFIKITEIENYSLSGYKPRSSETNPDIIL